MNENVTHDKTDATATAMLTCLASLTFTSCFETTISACRHLKPASPHLERLLTGCSALPTAYKRLRRELGEMDA